MSTLSPVSSNSRLTLLEAGVLECLQGMAESHLGRPTPPGVWIGSATALARRQRRGPSPRRVREALARLQQLGFLRAWCDTGHRGAYPILLDRHPVTSAAGQRLLTCAARTRDWRAPVLIPLPQAQPAAQPETVVPGAWRHLDSFPDHIHLLYRQQRGHLAPAPPLTPARRRYFLEQALRWPAGPAGLLLDLQRALRKARRSRFLLGANRTGQPFGLDWILDPDHLRNILLDRYSDPPAGAGVCRPVQSTLPWPEPEPPPVPVLAQERPSPEPLDRPDQARAAWHPIEQHLRAQMNPKSFSTWIAPLRPAGWQDNMLVLDAPTPDFSRVLERFAAHLPPGAPPLRLRAG